VTTVLLRTERIWGWLLGRLQVFTGSEPVVFAKTTLVTTGVTTMVWILVTLFTRPEPDAVLIKFYRKVRPHAAGWKRVAALAPDVTPTRDLGKNLLSWLLGCAMVYAALFGIGELCFQRVGLGMALLGAAAISALLIHAAIQRSSTEAMPQPASDR
jgi:hypothetical protein